MFCNIYLYHSAVKISTGVIKVILDKLFKRHGWA
jgi:hypothetical protein